MFPLRKINEKFSKRPRCFFLLHSKLVNRKKKTQKTSKHRHYKEIWGGKRKFVLPP